MPSVNYCDRLDRCILYCILFVFICVATEFSVNKDLDNKLRDADARDQSTRVSCNWVDLFQPV